MVNSDLAKDKKYIEHFKGEETIFLTNTKNQSFINSYLKEVKKRSENAYRVQKSVLYHFFEYVYEKLEDMCVGKIRKKDIKNYFNDIIDKKDIRLSKKVSYRSY